MSRLPPVAGAGRGGGGWGTPPGGKKPRRRGAGRAGVVSDIAEGRNPARAWVALRGGVSVDDIALAEGNGVLRDATSPLSLQGRATRAVAGNKKTADGTAVAGSYYQATAGT